MVKNPKDNDLFYNNFLKRKRLEQHKTLEEVAEGICTASYLSRIENNKVNVDEDYYIYLFKKLDINFLELKETKDYKIFQDLLKLSLIGDYKQANNLILEGLSTNFYLETEYDLMLLNHLIIQNSYYEARSLILKLEEKIDIMLEEELLFYLILKSLLYYKMYEGIKAFKQILVLCEGIPIIPIYKFAVIDVALDIFIYVGYHEIFFKYYQIIDTEDFRTFYPRSYLKHQAQKIYLEYSIRKDETYRKLCDLKLSDSYVDVSYLDILMLKSLYRTHDVKYIYKILINLNYNSFVLAYEAILILKLKDESSFKHFLMMLKGHNFLSYEYYLELICKTVLMIKQNVEPISILEQIKELINLLKDKIYDKFYLDIFKIIYLEIALKLGKYKEACLKTLDMEKHPLVIPYLL